MVKQSLKTRPECRIKPHTIYWNKACATKQKCFVDSSKAGLLESDGMCCCNNSEFSVSLSKTYIPIPTTSIISKMRNKLPLKMFYVICKYLGELFVFFKFILMFYFLLYLLFNSVLRVPFLFFLKILNLMFFFLIQLSSTFRFWDNAPFAKEDPHHTSIIIKY